MKTVTVDQFLSFDPCWDEERVRDFAGDKNEWTALDVLEAKGVSAEDKLWAVLREEFIDAPILHEFACRCAENALKMVDNPDPRSVEAITVKRRWLRGEATDEDLAAATAAAWAAATAAARARDAAIAAARTAARAAASAAARDTARTAARARDAARTAARDAAWAAARDAAWTAAWAAARAAARSVAADAARDAQVQMLIDMLEVE